MRHDFRVGHVCQSPATSAYCTVAHRGFLYRELVEKPFADHAEQKAGRMAISTSQSLLNVSVLHLG